jgi:hypothetical protein
MSVLNAQLHETLSYAIRNNLHLATKYLIELIDDVTSVDMIGSYLAAITTIRYTIGPNQLKTIENNYEILHFLTQRGLIKSDDWHQIWRCILSGNIKFFLKHIDLILENWTNIRIDQHDIHSMCVHEDDDLLKFFIDNAHLFDFSPEKIKENFVFSMFSLNTIQASRTKFMMRIIKFMSHDNGFLNQCIFVPPAGYYSIDFIKDLSNEGIQIQVEPEMVPRLYTHFGNNCLDDTNNIFVIPNVAQINADSLTENLKIFFDKYHISYVVS